MEATQELPGSQGKIDVLLSRLERYEAQEIGLHHPDDDQTPASPPNFEFDSQYQDREPCVLTPQQRLAAGVIREALESIQQFRKAKTESSGMTPYQVTCLGRQRLDAIQSVNWLFSDEPSRHNRLSFADVCEMFGADPDAMRPILSLKLGGNLEEGELL